MQPSTGPGVVVQPAYQPTTVSRSGERPGFSHTVVLVLGILKVILGVLTFSLGITEIAIKTGVYIAATPVWCGLTMVITGIVSVFAAKYKGTKIIIATMVLCIITAAIFSPTLLIMEGLSILLVRGWATIYLCTYEECTLRYDSQYGIHITGMVIPVIYAVIAIINSAFCCRAVCCQSSTPSTVVYYQPQTMTPTQTVTMYSHTIQPTGNTYPDQSNIPPAVFTEQGGYSKPQ